MSFRNYYDTSSYGRSRDTGKLSSHNADRPTSVTAKYLNTTPSYKSSSIPILCRDRSATREESPISAIANKYSNYGKKNKEDQGKQYDKQDNYKLSVPNPATGRSRDVSPVSTSSKYSIRSSLNSSPEIKSKITKGRSPDPSSERDIPNKSEKSTGYSSLSSYKLYPRTSSYTRPSSRPETKSDIAVNRYAIANRLSSNYLRSPSVDKSRSSVSPVNHRNVVTPKSEIDKCTSPTIVVQDTSRLQGSDDNDYDENETETVVVVTRHTSPTPPGSSAYVRARRADMAKTIEKTLTRPRRKPVMVDKEIQSDRLDDPTRNGRFASTARSNVSNWSLYTPSPSSYTGYAGRYSTQYSNANGYERSSRSRSTEPTPLENTSKSPQSEDTHDSREDHYCNNELINNNVSEIKPEMVTVYEQSKGDDTSEIIINVNLKLKKAIAPLVTSAELVSPEITITNNQLPPQAPKPDGVVSKTKKIKVRKTSADSSSDSSASPKKKIVKKRSKSVSSNDSDQTSESSKKDKSKTASSKASSKSPSKSPPKSNSINEGQNSKHSKTRMSDSPESIVTLSTQSSVSEDETSKSKTNDYARTSADELSLSTDQSGIQPSPSIPQKNEGTEEAKSFLIRALAPVTNLFKTKHNDSADSRWMESTTSESTGKDISNLITESDRSNKSKNITGDIVASNDDNVVKLKAIRHIESGERAWWLDSESDKQNVTNNDRQKSGSDKNLPKKIRHIESGERAWWLDSESDKQNISSNGRQVSGSDQNIPKKIRHIESGERAWWLESNSSGCQQNEKEVTQSSELIYKKSKYDDEKPWWLDGSANIPEGVDQLTPSRKSSSESEKFDFFKVRRIESGEQKDWWLTSNDNSSSKQEAQSHSNSLSKSGSDQRSFPLRRIKHVESGERPWWLSSSQNIPEGVEKLPTPPPQAESDSSDSEEVKAYVPVAQIPPFPLNLPDDEPLGDRRSPEGLETPKESENYEGRLSPYENSRQYRNSNLSMGYQNTKKYVSRYTDIDDILGTCSQIYSPFMDSVLAKRTGHMPYDDNSECEEIDSTQVKIHDSTAQRPVIKKVRSRSEIIDCRDEDQLDDAALQVFKDGEYGAYLDPDSTMGEQEEELEGLQDSRKNVIILRTQLSVRVHALIERLLHSQGRELRRALFSLKQVLQSDDDLVHEFVANKGLDCLMQLGNMADHNYLDYILRALGQILLYVDGMTGVMAHNGCVQWLYSLVLSPYRYVVKTALKLLLVFVDYVEGNSLLLVDAITAVDGANRRPPWHNVMRILQDFDASDTELLIYATSLINKCLMNIPSRDVYYDHVDALLDQGMDDIIQLYMSKQGTDLDLLRQLQIFEAVLLYEDGDDTVTALKQLDESVILSLRRRNMNTSSNGAEKRKSKKHRLNEKVNVNGMKRIKCEIKPLNGIHLPAITINDKENKTSSEEGDVKSRVKPLIASPTPMLRNGHQRYTTGLKQRIQNGTLGHSVNSLDALTAMRQKQLDNTQEKEDRGDRGVVITKKNSIKDIAQRLTAPSSPTTEDKPSRVTDMYGVVSKAKKELAKSQSKEVIKPPTVDIAPKPLEAKPSEYDLQWEELKRRCANREYRLCELDFSELREDGEDEGGSGGGVPPPAPLPPPPPPAPLGHATPAPVPPPSESSDKSDGSTMKRDRKTVRLFWREIQDASVPEVMKAKAGGLIWDELPEVKLDTDMLEHLFKSRTNDLILKEKIAEPKRNLILDAKRSNAINIAMKKLPTPQTIKAAIMKMDVTVVGREGVEKLLTMMPTEEEKIKIQEAQYANPHLPLGSAEQFLLTLASINELPSRLKLWVFKLDFDNLEKEIAEPLMDLKLGIELLKKNLTFKAILSMLRSVGSFLNGSQVKGFRLEYLSKVMEVKDTVHKHPLLYHICDMIINKFPKSTDLFSEVGPVIRASKVDFDVLNSNLAKLETDCKASWEHMKRVAKHDPTQISKTKINEFLTDAAERTILLTIIKKKVMNRYRNFLLYLGVPLTDVDRTKPSEFLKVIAEFALEYRTSRERVLQQLEKKLNHRERNKTRGKMIIDVASLTAKSNGDNSADIALKNLLKTDSYSDGVWDSRRKSSQPKLLNGDHSVEDEIIQSIVQPPPQKRRPVRERKRGVMTNDRRGLRRALSPTGQNTWPMKEN